ncbi:TetR/AcrR family transcriptional regulator [Deinococcus planocerae]|uniref:TetR/AcrR family transcriptional regulator n=1 Tax=Deinococcus planocerae TaxID=1737569 RepID=UPI000C7EF5FA|nr:TetR/AcrR family transcriptional regulator [Deinococcus planocerae]
MTAEPSTTAVPGPTAEPPGARLGARERILDTARTLFYRRGVNNVGIDEIIAESGVAKATLYKHFSSKDALTLEYMRQGDLRWTAWLRGRVEELSPDPAGRLLAVFGALEEWFGLPHFRGCLLTNVVTALPDPEHPAREVLAGHKARVRAYLAELATQAGASHPEVLADQTLMLIEGATAVARMERDPGAADRAKATAHLLLKSSETEAGTT